MSPLFSIVIPTLNEEENIKKLLGSIAHQSYKNLEVIVNDSGSKDKTKAVVESFIAQIPQLQFVEYPTKNVSGARNNGAHLAQAEWLVFFDADVHIEPHFFKEIQKKIAIDCPDMFSIWNRPFPKTFKGSIAFGMMNLSLSMFQKIKPAANGPCIIMKKSVFNSINGFDDTIFFGEDFDIVQRAWKKGAKMRVYQTPKLYVSTRRFEKEGLLQSMYKSIKAIVYQLFFGPIRKPIFHYEMGGQYYKKSK